MSRSGRAMATLALVAAARAGLMQSSASGQSSARAPRNIFGTYGQTGAGRDSIRISPQANGKIAMSIRLYFSSGHTCRLERNGEWREDHVAVIAEGLNANHPCMLNAFFDNGRILLKDEGLQCAPVYCGTRGKLDNVGLPKINVNRK